MAKDWAAVADAISARMDELELTQQQVASRAGVALQTVRELQHNLVERNRTARTLEAMSAALDLPRGYLGAVLRGQPLPADGQPADSAAIADLRAKLANVTERLEALEERVAHE
ncbi:helix-turn-helix transcriptional regulator [Saccharopolyspora cebuensis]|uniref:Helix-turn-helix domain-containing protein n=1 Tax=Saccharopolyspora cebuensis TaxID=418759 RepID=A0ABV4CIY4_9PSEU